ncbi:hypothetical protein H740_04565 [Campylobacter showae CC57C]|uniref:Uncharacterized protein n=1 Tax=Campylobacter showae CC57C TaxID=1073353 RepID=M3GZE5_9BACT|nr:hypothetical protein H740_04565 [Campylobacter showae CC57C]
MYSEIVYNIYHFLMQVGFSSFYACMFIGAIHALPVAILFRQSVLLVLFYIGTTSYVWATFAANNEGILTLPSAGNYTLLFWTSTVLVGAASAISPKEPNLYTDFMIPCDIGVD